MLARNNDLTSWIEHNCLGGIDNNCRARYPITDVEVLQLVHRRVDATIRLLEVNAVRRRVLLLLGQGGRRGEREIVRFERVHLVPDGFTERIERLADPADLSHDVSAHGTHE